MSITKEITFDRDGLVPVAVTDCKTQRLLVLCYMNKEALEKTHNERKIHVYRRSLGKVVPKGIESGHVQEVQEIRINCDKNSLEVRVSQHVAACAYGYYSCYFRSWDEEQNNWVIREDQIFDPDTVYS